jgi:aspartate aminotransferase
LFSEEVKHTIYFKILNSKFLTNEFYDKLLTQEKVATIPGIAFGDDNCIRLSYATDMESIEKGMTRLGNFIQSL